MTICLPLVILACCVGAAEVPCVDALLLGPDTALVGMRQPEYTRAETVRDHEGHVEPRGAGCWYQDVPHPRGGAFARPAGQGATK